MAHVIETKDISNSLGEIGALRGLSLRVEKGVLWLLGPNGAGKTTTVRILPDLARLDERRLGFWDATYATTWMALLFLEWLLFVMLVFEKKRLNMGLKGQFEWRYGLNDVMYS